MLWWNFPNNKVLVGRLTCPCVSSNGYHCVTGFLVYSLALEVINSCGDASEKKLQALGLFHYCLLPSLQVDLLIESFQDGSIEDDKVKTNTGTSDRKN